MTGSFAAITASNEVKCATYVNTKVSVSPENWPPKYWKFNLLMDDNTRVAFVAVCNTARKSAVFHVALTPYDEGSEV